jgi:hypothetical protein
MYFGVFVNHLPMFGSELIDRSKDEKACLLAPVLLKEALAPVGSSIVLTKVMDRGILVLIER